MTDVGDESQNTSSPAEAENDPTLNHPMVREEIKHPARSAEQAIERSADDPTLNHPMVREETAHPAPAAEQSAADPTLNHPMVRDEIRQPARSAEASLDDPTPRPNPIQRIKNWAQAILMPRTQLDVLGDRGENVAAKHLRNQGYKIIERNFRCPVGEIDIIARDCKTLVFVEVKTRAYDDQDVTPEDQVNTTKRHQITKAAKFYLTRYGWPQPPARFDVVAIVWPTGRQPMIRHTQDAFEATF